MKKYLITNAFLLIIYSCNRSSTSEYKLNGKELQNSSIEEKIENLRNSKDNKIIVVAHRGDWHNAPENSLQAIQNCIDIGVDIVEVDVRKTKDNQLVKETNCY